MRRWIKHLACRPFAESHERAVIGWTAAGLPRTYRLIRPRSRFWELLAPLSEGRPVANDHPVHLVH